MESSGSQSVFLIPAVSTSCWNLMEMQIHRSYPRPTEWIIWGVESSELCCNKPSVGVQCTLLLESHWSWCLSLKCSSICLPQRGSVKLWTEIMMLLLPGGNPLWAPAFQSVCGWTPTFWFLPPHSNVICNWHHKDKRGPPDHEAWLTWFKPPLFHIGSGATTLSVWKKCPRKI